MIHGGVEIHSDLGDAIILNFARVISSTSANTEFGSARNSCICLLESQNEFTGNGALARCRNFSGISPLVGSGRNTISSYTWESLVVIVKILCFVVSRVAGLKDDLTEKKKNLDLMCSSMDMRALLKWNVIS